MIAIVAFIFTVWLMIKVFKFGVRAAWGGIRLLCSLILIPIAVVGIFGIGLIGLIVLVLVVGGIVASAFRHTV